MPRKKPQQNDLSPEQIRTIASRNLGLVYKIAWRFKVLPKDSFTREDLIQEGVLGLMRSIELCDFSSSKSFSAFAGKHIEGQIKRYYRDRKELVRPSRGCPPLKIFSGDHSKIIDGDPLLDSIPSPWTPYAEDRELLEQIEASVKDLSDLTKAIVKAKASGLNDRDATKAVGCNVKTLARHLDKVRKICQASHSVDDTGTHSL